MPTEQERAYAQFQYEREHHQKILKSQPGLERSKAFTDAYSGLAEGQKRGDFLDQETEPKAKARQKFRLLKRFLLPSSHVAECGPGNYDLARLVASKVQSLTAVDVVEPSAEVNLPRQCMFQKSDGVHLPNDLNNLDLVWSSHVIEHIHPEEVAEHLLDAYRALRPGGHYIAFTPNKLSGPHDISRDFTATAEGLHLKEYTNKELRRAFKAAGFNKIYHYAGGKGLYIQVPAFWPIVTEWKLSLLPTFARKFLASCLPVKALLGIIIVAKK